MNRLIIVMARVPILGQVKTRLAKSIGDHAAFWIYKKLLNKTIKTIDSSYWKTAIFFDPKPNSIAPYQNISKYILTQKGTTLGERLINATTWGFDQGYQQVIVVGSDLWDINQDTLINGFHHLEDSDFVIGPTYDGGYYLIGMRFYLKSLFKNTSWSTDRVFEQTVNKLIHHKTKILEKKNDIDSIDDLKKEKELYQLYLKNFQ
ncbi:MAG: TIGR04282 family arsenosugar biosynthesis glycosyltransferase [Flavobacteriaceae bacterium]|nr:TIGR04282 family arsenosugar biosynthesis glycosyltransferase [Flavobacteriaceae bacterium]